jgi:hypothetical protein
MQSECYRVEDLEIELKLNWRQQSITFTSVTFCENVESEKKMMKF